MTDLEIFLGLIGVIGFGIGIFLGMCKNMFFYAGILKRLRKTDYINIALTSQNKNTIYMNIKSIVKSMFLMDGFMYFLDNYKLYRIAMEDVPIAKLLSLDLSGAVSEIKDIKIDYLKKRLAEIEAKITAGTESITEEPGFSDRLGMAWNLLRESKAEREKRIKEEIDANMRAKTKIAQFISEVESMDTAKMFDETFDSIDNRKKINAIDLRKNLVSVEGVPTLFLDREKCEPLNFGTNEKVAPAEAIAGFMVAWDANQKAKDTKPSIPIWAYVVIAIVIVGAVLSFMAYNSTGDIKAGITAIQGQNSQTQAQTGQIQTTTQQTQQSIQNGKIMVINTTTVR